MGPFAPAVTWRAIEGLGSHIREHAALEKEHCGQRAPERNVVHPRVLGRPWVGCTRFLWGPIRAKMRPVAILAQGAYA